MSLKNAEEMRILFKTRKEQKRQEFIDYELPVVLDKIGERIEQAARDGDNSVIVSVSPLQAEFMPIIRKALSEKGYTFPFFGNFMCCDHRWLLLIEW